MGHGAATWALWIVGAAFALTACDGSDRPDGSDGAVARPGATEVTSAATSALPGTPPPAKPSGPSTFSSADDRWDVVSTSKEADWFDGAVRSPGQSSGDIIGMNVAHTSHEIGVRVRLAELRPRRDGPSASLMRISLQLMTSRRTSRDVEIWVGTDSPDLQGVRLVPEGNNPCGMRHAVDTDRDTVTLRIPGACLGDPAWVRVAASCLSFPTTRTMSLDIAMVKGYGPRAMDKLSPRIYRS